MTLLVVGFWICAVGLAYIYIGYPAIIGFLAKLRPRPIQRGTNGLSVTVIISVYNEAIRLPTKLRNVLELDEAGRIGEILVGSDGSSDNPGQAVAAMNETRIRLFEFAERRGKPSVLNDLIKQATGDVLVMMDVRQRLDNKALAFLLANFSDPSIGVVSAEMLFERSQDDTAAASGIDTYWRYERWIRTRESRFHSMPGASGALYAIRRELAQPIPATAALDDVLIPMQAIARGFRCVMEPAAVLYDRPAQDTASESIRKRRTLAGCVQLLKLHPNWCLPGGHPIWWQFSSHKITRLFSPFMMAGALACSTVLAFSSVLYASFAALQWLVYAVGVVELSKGKTETAGQSMRIPKFIGVFLSMQVAILTGWKDGLGVQNLAVWRKAAN